MTLIFEHYDETRTSTARLHHPLHEIGEDRKWLLELLAIRGTATTSELAKAIGRSRSQTSIKLLEMEQSRSVKPVALAPGRTRQQFVWALRCHPLPSIRRKEDAA